MSREMLNTIIKKINYVNDLLEKGEYIRADEPVLLNDLARLEEAYNRIVNGGSAREGITQGGFGIETSSKTVQKGSLFGGLKAGITTLDKEDPVLPQINSIRHSNIAPKVKDVFPKFAYFRRLATEEKIVDDKRVLFGYVEEETPEIIVETEEYNNNPLLLDSSFVYVTPVKDVLIPSSIINEEYFNIAFNMIEFEEGTLLTRYLNNVLGKTLKGMFYSVDFNIYVDEIDGMREILAKKDLPADGLQRINTFFKKIKLVDSEVKGMKKLLLNTNHIYLEIEDDNEIIENINKNNHGNEYWFINATSYDVVYNSIKSTGSDFGILETINNKFKYYVGHDKILLTK